MEERDRQRHNFYLFFSGPGSQGAARTYSGSLLTSLPRHRVAELEAHLPNPWKKQTCTQDSCLPHAASPVAVPADVLPKLCPAQGTGHPFTHLPITLVSQTTAFLCRDGSSFVEHGGLWTCRAMGGWLCPTTFIVQLTLRSDAEI